MMTLILCALGASIGGILGGFAIAAFAIGGKSDDYDELNELRACKASAEQARPELVRVASMTNPNRVSLVPEAEADQML
jgi:hypothetical protein